MRIAAVSDPHVGNFPKFGGAHVSGINERCTASLQSLHRAVHAANKHECEYFVVNGDLFDTDTPTPQVEAAVISALQPFNGDVHLIVGNHDQRSMSEGDHALGPLNAHRTAGGEIVVHEVPGVIEVDGHRILFAPFNQSAVGEWLPQLLAMHKPHTVFAHFGIIDSKTPEFLRHAGADAHDWESLREMMDRAGTRLLCVGNWHDHGSWTSKQSRIEQVGALTPTGFDNLGPTFGRVLLIDTGVDPSKQVKAVKISGPRFVKLVWGSDLAHQLAGHGTCIYAHMEAEPTELPAARAWLKGPGVQAGIKDYTLVPSKVSAVKQARAAAKATSQASNMREALEAYIAKMPVPGAVDRGAVSRRVQGYLKAVGGLNE